MNIFEIENKGKAFAFNVNSISNVVLTSSTLSYESQIEKASIIIVYCGHDREYLYFETPIEAKATYDKIIEEMKKQV